MGAQQKAAGEARMASLTAEERTDLSRRAGKARAEALPEEVRLEISRRGGQAGGPARARKLSRRRRREIARNAALARWASASPSDAAPGPGSPQR